VKTKIVFCKDANRPGHSEYTSFDFLGYTFWSFAPAMSAEARRAVAQQVRHWHLNRRSRADLFSLAADINPTVRGWIGQPAARTTVGHSSSRSAEHHLTTLNLGLGWSRTNSARGMSEG
jgi:hypothetical protein